MIKPYSAATRNMWLKETKPAQPGPVPTCPICGGHGYIFMDIMKPGFDENGKPMLHENGANVLVFDDVAVRKCECVYGGGFGLAMLGVPTRFLDCTLEKYQPQNDSQERALKACAAFVRGYPHNKKSLLMSGLVGTGKTHLAVGILAGIRVGTFIDTSELLKRMKNEMDSDGPKMAMEEAREAELLVLDDLGFERQTEWAQSEIAGLLGYRYNENLPTIITTNLKPGKRLEERVTPRIASRLHEMCDVCNVIGKDWRITQHK